MSDPRLKLMEAIARRRVVAARYNGAVIKLAPHMMFERDGDLFVSAFNMGKVRRSYDDLQLGQLKLAGLGEVGLLDEQFTPLPSYDAAVPRWGDKPILAI